MAFPWQRFSPNNMGSNTTPVPFTASASDEILYPAWRCFDGSGLHWESNSLPAWVSLDLGRYNFQRLFKYTLQTGNDPGKIPVSWQIQGNTVDDPWSWVDIDSKTGQVLSSNSSYTYTINFGTGGVLQEAIKYQKYRFFRFYCTAVVSASSVEIAELIYEYGFNRDGDPSYGSETISMLHFNGNFLDEKFGLSGYNIWTASPSGTAVIDTINKKFGVPKWITGTGYIFLDMVENNGIVYVCFNAHTSSAGSEPGIGGSWESYWFDIDSPEYLLRRPYSSGSLYLSGGGFISTSNAVSSPDSFKFGSSFYTIEFWMRTTATSGCIMSDLNYANDYGSSSINFWMNGNKILWIPYFDTGTLPPTGSIHDITSISDVNDNEWHHIVGMRILNVFILFIDGVNEGEITDWNPTINGTSQTVYIGKKAGDFPHHWTGNIDEFRVSRAAKYNRSGFTPPINEHTTSPPGLLFSYSMPA